MEQKTLTLHLISDSTGQTVSYVARSALEHFASVKYEEFFWSLISNRKQIDQIMDLMKDHKDNFVLYTMMNDDIRSYLKERCIANNIPCVPVLAHVIREISSYLNVKKDPHLVVGGKLDDDYFSKIDAINYTISHDDGQNMWDIDDADIIIVGVSRTSKSPTSIYLAYRGYKVANIPFVANIPLPIDLTQIKSQLVIGLIIDTNRLIQIRKSRLTAMKDSKNHGYVEPEKVLDEINQAKRFFAQNGWPVINVTQKSVEEIASTIIQYLNRLRLNET